MRPSETLRKSRELLEERGWTQGRLFRLDGTMCTVGAVHYAIHGAEPSWDFCEDEALRYLAVVLDKPTFDPAPSIEAWNDEAHRTLTEVLDALVHAEKLALEAENASE